MAAGVVMLLVGAMLHWGVRMPGDLTWRGKNWTLHFPLGTSILLSVLGTLLLWWFNRRQM